MEKVDELQNTVYYGLAALFVLWLASSAYLVMQNNALRSTVEANTITNDAELSSRLKAIESRLGVVESTSDYPSAELKFYYDSSCDYCNNSYWLSHLLEPPATGILSVKAKLANKNVALQVIDLKTSPAPADVKRVPAFYFDVIDVQNNRELNSYFQELANYADAYDGDNAVLLIPNDQDQETMLVHGEECVSEGTAYLDRYSPADCYLCDSADAAEETLKSALGDALQESRYCVSSDDQEKADCINSVGKEEYEAAMEAYAEFHLPVSTLRPSYVLDCRRVFQAQNFQQLKKEVCATHEELCGLLSLNATE